MYEVYDISSDDDSVVDIDEVYSLNDTEDECSSSFSEINKLNTLMRSISIVQVPKTPPSSPPLKKQPELGVLIQDLRKQLEHLSENQIIKSVLSFVIWKVSPTLILPITPENMIVCEHYTKFRDGKLLTLEEAEKDNRILAWIPQHVLLSRDVKQCWQYQIACFLFWVFNDAYPFLGRTCKETRQNIENVRIGVPLDKTRCSFPVQAVLWYFLHHRKLCGRYVDVVACLTNIAVLNEQDRKRRSAELWEILNRIELKLNSFNKFKCVCKGADTVYMAILSGCYYCFSRLQNTSLGYELRRNVPIQTIRRYSDDALFFIPLLEADLDKEYRCCLLQCFFFAVLRHLPEAALLAFTRLQFKCSEEDYIDIKIYTSAIDYYPNFSPVWEPTVNFNMENQIEESIRLFGEQDRDIAPEVRVMLYSQKYFKSKLIQLDYLKQYSRIKNGLQNRIESREFEVRLYEGILRYGIITNNEKVIQSYLKEKFSIISYYLGIRWRPEVVKWETYQLLLPHMKRQVQNLEEQDCVLFCAVGNMDIAEKLAGLPCFDVNVFFNILFERNIPDHSVSSFAKLISKLKSKTFVNQEAMSEYIKYPTSPNMLELYFQVIQEQHTMYFDKSPQFFLWEYEYCFHPESKTFYYPYWSLKVLEFMVKCTPFLERLQSTETCNAVLRGVGKQLVGGAAFFNQPDQNGVLPIWYAARLNNRDAVMRIMSFGISKAVWIGALRISLRYQCPDATRALVTFFGAVDLSDESLPAGAEHPLGEDWLVDKPNYKFVLNSYNMKYCQSLLLKLGIQFRDADSFSNRYTFRHILEGFDQIDLTGGSKRETELYQRDGFKALYKIYANELQYTQYPKPYLKWQDSYDCIIYRHDYSQLEKWSRSIRRFHRNMKSDCESAGKYVVNPLYFRDLALENVVSNRGKREKHFVFNEAFTFTRSARAVKNFEHWLVSQGPLPPKPHERLLTDVTKAICHRVRCKLRLVGGQNEKLWLQILLRCREFQEEHET